MEDIEKLIKTTLGEVQKVLNSKTVVGEPIKGGLAAALEKFVETVPDVIEKVAEKWGEGKKEDKK